MRRKISFEENISWAFGHMLDGRYYDQYKAGTLTVWQLNEIIQLYRQHRYSLSKVRKWYQFGLKRNEGKLLQDLDSLLKDIYNVAFWGRKIDLSKYGVNQ